MKKLSLFLSIFLTIFTLGISLGIVKNIQAYSQAKAAAKSNQAAQSTAAASQTQLASIPTQVIPLGYAVSPDQAAQIGLNAAGGIETLASQPELVAFSGIPAYEVKFTDGATLYVDAQTGLLLYNSLTGSNQPVISEAEALVAAALYMKSTAITASTRSFYGSTPVFDITFKTGSHIFVGLNGSIVAANIVKVVVNPPTTASNTSSTASPVQVSEREIGDDD